MFRRAVITCVAIAMPSFSQANRPPDCIYAPPDMNGAPVIVAIPKELAERTTIDCLSAHVRRLTGDEPNIRLMDTSEARIALEHLDVHVAMLSAEKSDTGSTLRAVGSAIWPKGTETFERYSNADVDWRELGHFSAGHSHQSYMGSVKYKPILKDLRPKALDDQAYGEEVQHFVLYDINCR